MLNLSKTVALLFVFFLSSSAHAEIKASDLPSMGNLAALLSKTDQKKSEVESLDQNGKISSNLPAPDTARGETAAMIAKVLSNGAKETEAALKNAFLMDRLAYEKALSAANFKVDDMGVAYAANFIMLWELASNVEMSKEASVSAGKFLVHSFAGMKEKFDQVPEEDKAKAYDWLMTTALAFYSLVKAYETQGMKAEAGKIREESATLFVQTFKLPHDLVTISEAGEFGISEAKVRAYQEENQLGSDW